MAQLVLYQADFLKNIIQVPLHLDQKSGVLLELCAGRFEPVHRQLITVCQHLVGFLKPLQPENVQSGR